MKSVLRRRGLVSLSLLLLTRPTSVEGFSPSSSSTSPSFGLEEQSTRYTFGLPFNKLSDGSLYQPEMHIPANRRISHSTVLRMNKKKDFDENDPLYGNDLEEARRRSDAIYGTGWTQGIPLLIFVFLWNVWFFTIPPEFRRSRLCDAADAAAYPERCMTAHQFASGIVEYYKGGGGIQWNFEVGSSTREFFEGNENDL